MCQSTGCETTQVGLRTLTWHRQVVPRGYVSQCQGGARVRGFSRSGKPRLLLKLIPVGRSFPTRPSFRSKGCKKTRLALKKWKYETLHILTSLLKLLLCYIRSFAKSRFIMTTEYYSFFLGSKYLAIYWWLHRCKYDNKIHTGMIWNYHNNTCGEG